MQPGAGRPSDWDPLLTRHSSHSHTLTEACAGLEDTAALSALSHYWEKHTVTISHHTPACSYPTGGHLWGFHCQTGLSHHRTCDYHCSSAITTENYLSGLFSSGRYMYVHVHVHVHVYTYNTILTHKCILYMYIHAHVHVGTCIIHLHVCILAPWMYIHLLDGNYM